MKDFTLKTYQFKSEFDVSEIQDHLDEFVVLVKLLGYKITHTIEEQDISFNFQSEKDFFIIVFKRTLNDPYKVFSVIFKAQSLKMAFLKKYGNMYFREQTDDTKSVVTMLEKYKEIV